MQSCGSAQAQAQRAQKEYPKPMSIAALGGLSKFVLPKPIALGASLELPKPHAMLRGDTVRAARRLSVGTSAAKPWRSSKCRLMLHFVRSTLYCMACCNLYAPRCIVCCILYVSCTLHVVLYAASCTLHVARFIARCGLQEVHASYAAFPKPQLLKPQPLKPNLSALDAQALPVPPAPRCAKPPLLCRLAPHSVAHAYNNALVERSALAHKPKAKLRLRRLMRRGIGGHWWQAAPHDSPTEAPAWVTRDGRRMHTGDRIQINWEGGGPQVRQPAVQYCLLQWKAQCVVGYSG